MDLKNEDSYTITPSKHLTPCPLCGSQPTILLFTDTDSERKEYKCFCMANRFHVGCGDWKKTQQLAEEDWEHRVRDRTQPDLYRPTNYDVIKNMICHDIDAETFADIIIYGDIREYLDIPTLRTKEEMLAWLMADCKKILRLKFIGRDSHGRPVYEDCNRVIWKDVEPRADRDPKLCSSICNAFDGEPDTPMDVMKAYTNIEIVFEPKRDTWY